VSHERVSLVYMSVCVCECVCLGFSVTRKSFSCVCECVCECVCVCLGFSVTREFLFSFHHPLFHFMRAFNAVRLRCNIIVH
jgi:hypothetical protein